MTEVPSSQSPRSPKAPQVCDGLGSLASDWRSGPFARTFRCVGARDENARPRDGVPSHKLGSSLSRNPSNIKVRPTRWFGPKAGKIRPNQQPTSVVWSLDSAVCGSLFHGSSQSLGGF